MYLTLDCFVKVSQVNTDTYTAIWFKDRDDTIQLALLQARSLLAEALFLSDFLPLEAVDGGSFLDCRDRKE